MANSKFDCLLAFGSNEGDRQDVFQAAVEKLGKIKSVDLVAVGQPLSTPAVGGPGEQASYLNSVIRLNSGIRPEELHQHMVNIENELGRVRRTRWGSRMIDLDLLLVGDLQLRSTRLTIPHPRMSFRRFVLEPASQIAGDMIHPTSGQTIDQLLYRINSSRPSILCTGCPAEEPLLRQICAEVQLNLDRDENSAWQIDWVTQFEDFQKRESTERLVTHFGLESDSPTALQTTRMIEDLQTVAISFAGPTLELPAELERAKLELLAAVEAMNPLT